MKASYAVMLHVSCNSCFDFLDGGRIDSLFKYPQVQSPSNFSTEIY
jgi:hypothetical protein